MYTESLRENKNIAFNGTASKYNYLVPILKYGASACCIIVVHAHKTINFQLIYQTFFLQQKDYYFRN